MDDAVRDALARVGRKVVPAYVRRQADRDDLSDLERAVVVSDINLLEEALLLPSGA